MFNVRDNEPNYALLQDKETKKYNQHGLPIDTITEKDERYGKSLKINGDEAVGDNPNRYKQHGFYFNADNCIACHACEAACSEKNETPAHLAFRSVGFVEGGTYPNYQRLNISMACNHCDDPVCLKGCPTRAYTKFAEYGAVLQDPDICFGCGYCTWVCPYNAPQLDPIKGEVTKCNMCVDRLEVGLKPACVSACLGEALDFGVIENKPKGRTQVKLEIPGFPSSDITHPNIRFQQIRATQLDMVRVDDTAVKYHRDNDSERFKPELDPKHGHKKEWNWKKLLGSHENAHIIFTLSMQMVMGAFLLLTLGAWTVLPEMKPVQNELGVLIPTVITLFVFASLGLYKLNMHLGKPHRFYRGFYNLKMSPVSREIAGVTLFVIGLSGYLALAIISSVWNNAFISMLSTLLALIGWLGIGIGGYFMYKLYRIEARPFWNHWYTGASFIATGLSLGSLLLALLISLWGDLSTELAFSLTVILAVGLLLEGVALLAHANDLHGAKSEGVASFYEQLTTYAYPYWIRNGLLLVSLILSLGLVLFGGAGIGSIILLSIVVLVVSVIGRALFYVLVIPTTMPGAFFWKNKGFVEHAKENGLANKPQVGVVYDRHHAFKLDELLATIRETSWPDKKAQIKRIWTG